MMRYDGLKFKRCFPSPGDTFITYEGSDGEHFNLATVVDSERWPNDSCRVRYVYYDHSRDQIVQSEQLGALDHKTFKVINV